MKKGGKSYFLLAVILFLGFLIRLIALNQSLWLDEATTAKVVQNYSLISIITKFSPTDFHPPLYYLFMKLWTNVFGVSEIALRMPSVLFSVLTGWVIFLIGRKLKDDRMGLFAATFFIFNPLIVYYSQEARMYSLVVLFLTIALYFYFEFLADSVRDFLPANAPPIKTGDARCREPFLLCHLLKINFFLILSFYTFYGSIFLIAAFFLYFLIKKQYKFFLISCLIFLISLLVIFPLLLKQLSNSRQALQAVANWRQVLGPASIKNLTLIFIKFSFGRISFYPKKIYYLISGVWTAVIFLFVAKGVIRNRFLGLLFIFPIFLGIIFSFWSPLLQYFRFLYLIPILSILLVFGLSNKANSNLLGSILVLGGFVALSMIYIVNPNFHREDWKSLVVSLSINKKVYMIKSSSDPLLYYNKNIEIADLKSIEKINESNILVIPYTADIHGVNYQKELANQGFYLQQKKSFRELTLEYWGK